MPFHLKIKRTFIKSSVILNAVSLDKYLLHLEVKETFFKLGSLKGFFFSSFIPGCKAKQMHTHQMHTQHSTHVEVIEQQMEFGSSLLPWMELRSSGLTASSFRR